jgi:hypothetical protein
MTTVVEIDALPHVLNNQCTEFQNSLYTQVNSKIGI